VVSNTLWKYPERIFHPTLEKACTLTSVPLSFTNGKEIMMEILPYLDGCMKNKAPKNISNLLLLSSLFIIAFTPLPMPVTASVNLNVNVSANRNAISPYIYGLNFATESLANELDLPLRRWGGNATSRYNWQTNTLNSANDWYFENSSNTNAYNWNLPETYDQWIEQNERTGTNSLITIPMLGYVSKNGSSCSYSVSKYGAQTSTDPWKPNCGNGILQSNGNPINNTPTDASIAVNESFMGSWVTTIVNDHGLAADGGVRFYALDNEPELWSETHRDVHPADQTYEELLAKSINYGEAIKAIDPGALLVGYSSFGWSGYWYSWQDLEVAAGNGYTYFPDYATHGNLHQVEWYLTAMHNYEVTHDTRLLDYLDLHYYPASGVALGLAGNTSQQALRLRSTRSLWDPTYRDESWIGGNDQEHQYVQLIPRMREWVDTFYPGTKTAITEYNFGGLEHINGALTQADVLGIFGREGVDMAALWNYPTPNDVLGYDDFETLPGAYAFRMYRNYDGNGGKFGETSINAVSADQSKLSIYAAQRNNDSALTLIIINKTTSRLDSTLSIANFQSNGYARRFEYSAADLNTIMQKADLVINNNTIETNFPANSITLLVIPAQPASSTFKSNPGNDGWILESSETSNTGGTMNSAATTIPLGDDATDKQYRAILHFDTSSLPDTAVVTNMTLKIKQQGAVTGVNPFTFGSLYVDMRNPAFGNSILELVDFSFAAKKVKTAVFNPNPVNGWFSARFNTGGKLYVNRTGTTQLRLYFSVDDNNNNVSDFIRFYSGNAAAGDRPKLLITYYVP
jgi:hypothetical protein